MVSCCVRKKVSHPEKGAVPVVVVEPIPTTKEMVVIFDPFGLSLYDLELIGHTNEKEGLCEKMQVKVVGDIHLIKPQELFTAGGHNEDLSFQYEEPGKDWRILQVFEYEDPSNIAMYMQQCEYNRQENAIKMARRAALQAVKPKKSESLPGMSTAKTAQQTVSTQDTNHKKSQEVEHKSLEPQKTAPSPSCATPGPSTGSKSKKVVKTQSTPKEVLAKPQASKRERGEKVTSKTTNTAKLITNSKESESPKTAEAISKSTKQAKGGKSKRNKSKKGTTSRKRKK